MDPKSIVRYLHMKDWTASAIHDDLVAMLGEEAIAYSTMTMYLRDAQINSAYATPGLETTSLYFISSHLISSHLISYHLIAPRRIKRSYPASP
jgi:hypothetical protein